MENQEKRAKRFRMIEIPGKHVRVWENETVVYDERCGETHLLPGAMGTVCGWLREDDHDFNGLLRRLDQSGLDNPLDNIALLHRLLAELKRHQLLDEMRSDSE